eukprot:jgi/Astpho2/9836/Aster-03800
MPVQVLRQLPLDRKQDNRPRMVQGAVFTRVPLQPLTNPQLVAYSADALRLLDLTPEEASSLPAEKQDFAEFFAGNKLLNGSEPAAQCYCGFQFGLFSGQLGDGAAMYLGEVINQQGERWEVQLKGSGLTPFSRTADGRKVLRSSIREFLASEALYHLGIPTTRAGSVVTSDDRVTRDLLYTGNPIRERCSVVMRIAPTFLRFGTFEVFRKRDPQTGREGPSHGLEGDMLRPLLDFTIKQYLPDIWAAHGGGNTTNPGSMYLDFFREVVRRTAGLVAAWQSVGFTHGVLNTDNMSIVGATLDYGPYGFMNRQVPCSNSCCLPRQHHNTIPQAGLHNWGVNCSALKAKYDYQGQPDICYWNCGQLAEALKHVLPLSESQPALTHMWHSAYQRAYNDLMQRKLGLLADLDLEEQDQELVEGLLKTMHETGADFTNTFRKLAEVPMPGASTSGEQQVDNALLDRFVAGLASAEVLAKAAAPRLPAGQVQMLLMLANRDKKLLEQLGASEQANADELQRFQDAERWRGVTPEQKQQQDRDRWRSWLMRYTARLGQEAAAGTSSADRVRVMNSTNPRYILHNWIAQQAIEKAEAGDYSEVRRVLKLLEHPFSDDIVEQLPPGDSGGSTSCQRGPPQYDGPVPDQYQKLCVSCSS